jgi:hypothetical protein
MANFLKKFFSRSENPSPVPTDTSPRGVFSGLRNQALTLDKDILNLPEDARPFVWGVLMETDYTGVTATLFTLVDGTTSLYLSNGGGMLGGQGHEPIRRASAAFIELANKYRQYLAPCDSYPVPTDEGTLFYFLTDSGVMRLDAPVTDPSHEENIPLLLFGAGQDILTELRLVHESSDQPPPE